MAMKFDIRKKWKQFENCVLSSAVDIREERVHVLLAGFNWGDQKMDNLQIFQQLSQEQLDKIMLGSTCLNTIQ